MGIRQRRICGRRRHLFLASLFLEQKGAAVRYVTQFGGSALARKKADASERIKLLATCDLMRHLPADRIEQILPCISDRHLQAGKICSARENPGDALYIVARGTVDVLANGMRDSQTPGEAIAQLGVGQAFGEMSLLSGGPRDGWTIRAAEDTDLMKIGKKDFDQLVAADRQLADAVQQISHQRAISNLSAGGTDAALWAKVASRSLDHLNRHRVAKDAEGGR